MSKITLEDINTWIKLFNFDIPIELDLSTDGEFELYDWGEDDVLKPKFNFSNSYFTIADDSVVFNTDNTITLENYNRINPFYLFTTLEPLNEDLTPQLFYFNPVSNINRLLFENDDLLNRKCYIDYLGNEQRPINDNTPYSDENGWYVPLSIVLDDEIKCDVENSKSFTPKIDYIYAPPLINVIEPLYIGNTNNLKNNVSSPVDYKIYYNNKEITDFSVPLTDYKDNYRFKIVTKSEYPYIPFETYVTIPVEFKLIQYKTELGIYEYSKLIRDIAPIEDITLTGLDNTVDLDDHILSTGKITNNKKSMFVNGKFQGLQWVNDDELSFTDCNFSNSSYIVNNGKLTIDNSVINGISIINNGELNILNSNLDLTQSAFDLPVIHNTGTYNIINNSITVTGSFNNNNIIFIRGLNQETDLLSNNSFNYDAKFVDGEISHKITGNGYTYSNIDDDSIILRNLEVQ